MKAVRNREEIPDEFFEGRRLCGIDEAGRGPIAGPLTAAAVMFTGPIPPGLNDSKALSETKRKTLFPLIQAASVWAVSWVWPWEIDQYNIHQSTLLAMKRAFLLLKAQKACVIVDGKWVPDLGVPALAMIKADTMVQEVMAASILAKTSRDAWMERYSWIETEYRFEKHKGYPTKEHRDLIRVHGLSSIARKSFSFD
jgi:ribonuclease HII